MLTILSQNGVVDGVTEGPVGDVVGNLANGPVGNVVGGLAGGGGL